MKRLGKITLGALMLAGTAAVAAPASAQVHFGIGIAPRYYGPPPRAACDPYSRWYDPYRCDPYYYGYRPSYGYSYGPAIGFGFGGTWGGHRHFHHHHR